MSKIQIHSLKDLKHYVKSFVKELQGGEVILLSGELGAGKTTFVQMLAEILQTSQHVSSPTFVLRNEYTSKRFRILHIDLYRLEKTQHKNFEFLENVGDADTITCIEWPERLVDSNNIKGKKIRLKLSIVSGDTREIVRS